MKETIEIDKLILYFETNFSIPKYRKNQPNN